MKTYLDVYQYFFNKTQALSEQRLKKYLISANPDSNYSHLRSQALKKIHFFIDKYNKRLSDNYPNSIIEFKNRSRYYSNNAIALILENELYNTFKKENLNSTHKNYTYFHFIADIAICESLDYACNITDNNTPLFEKMFLKQNFSGFKLEYYKNNPKLVNLEKKLSEDLYGKEQIIPEIFDQNFNNSGRNLLNPEIKNIELYNVQSLFTEDEKILLIHICYYYLKHKDYQFSLVEFAKINFITQGVYNNEFIKSEKASNSSFYIKLNKGITYYKKDKAHSILNNLNSKLEKLEEYNFNSLFKVIMELRKQIR